ncbi:MAG: pyridoxamine 5'-phosphate oxidase family protein [Thaumarchaeota archaeon]|nr:pyridoxamine 5'-phosphate oxidase family protein [Nitrososphaerota archaeon]MCL5317159.1 pyridoxamine 5'-phosphate oxidase family protein [Nitrososphaerota archaeon]
MGDKQRLDESRSRAIKAPFTFAYVEKQLRRKNYGVLSTVTPKGRAHSAGVAYGVSPPGSPLRLYLISRPSLKKPRNIKTNPNVSFTVPFPHYLLRMVPPSSIKFQGTAEILSINDPEARQVFNSSLVLRRSLKYDLKIGESIFIRIVPAKKIFSWGLGASICQLLRNPPPTYYVDFPSDPRENENPEHP